jgi:hypothetical protein
LFGGKLFLFTNFVLRVKSHGIKINKKSYLDIKKNDKFTYWKEEVILCILCDCGGILLVIAVEELPKHLTDKEKIKYNRVCDVQCQKCGKILYSQPYDDRNGINLVRKKREYK